MRDKTSIKVEGAGVKEWLPDKEAARFREVVFLIASPPRDSRY